MLYSQLLLVAAILDSADPEPKFPGNRNMGCLVHSCNYSIKNSVCHIITPQWMVVEWINEQIHDKWIYLLTLIHIHAPQNSWEWDHTYYTCLAHEMQEVFVKWINIWINRLWRVKDKIHRDPYKHEVMGGMFSHLWKSDIVY